MAEMVYQQRPKKSADTDRSQQRSGDGRLLEGNKVAFKGTAQLEAMTESSPQTNKQARLAAMINSSPAMVAQRKVVEDINSSPYVTTQRQKLNSLLGGTAQRGEEEEPVQGKSETAQRVEETAKPNNTGLPDNLKSGIEALSGLSMDNVKVHYNSSQPAQLNALAYAQGTDIHVAPGQEKHLPHEVWHVVQQAHGRVRPTMQTKDRVKVNDDEGLEREADVMGERGLASIVQRLGVGGDKQKTHLNFPTSPHSHIRTSLPASPQSAIVQLTRVQATVTGISHLVKIAGHSIYRGVQGQVIWQGMKLLIDTSGRYRSRRGPNQEIHAPRDQNGQRIYRWFPALTLDDLPLDPGMYVREDAVRIGADANDEQLQTPLKNAKYLTTAQLTGVLVPDRTIAMRAQNSGDMYHIRGAMIAHPEYALLIWNVTPETKAQAQQAIDLVGDLIRQGRRVYYTEGERPSRFNKTETTATEDITRHIGMPNLFDALDELNAGLPEDAQRPGSRPPAPSLVPRKRGESLPLPRGLTTSFQQQIGQNIGKLKAILGRAQKSPENAPIVQDLHNIGRRMLIKDFANKYGAYTPSEGYAFAQDLKELGQFVSGKRYVLVNFRGTGHSNRPGANAPALDTGTEGMSQLMKAVQVVLGEDVVVVPMGEEPSDFKGPNLLNYWTWPSARDRRQQLSLIKYLADNFKIIGAIGMRSGVIDQLAFAGIPVISIDLTPHRFEQKDNVPTLGPSKGWDRGLKMEHVYGPTYGRVFLEHPRDKDTTKNVPKWAGAFEGNDIETIMDGINFYFNAQASDTNYMHSSHPLHQKTVLAAVKGLPQVKELSAYDLFNRMHPYIAHLKMHGNAINDKSLKERIIEYCAEVDQAISDIEKMAKNIIQKEMKLDCPVTVKWMAEHQMQALLSNNQDYEHYTSQIGVLTSSKLFSAKSEEALNIYQLFDKIYRTPLHQL